MSCSSCGKTEQVSIGNKRYCTNCGSQVQESAATSQAVTVAKPSFSDIAKPGSVPAVIASEPAKAVLPPVASAAARPRMSDIVSRPNLSRAPGISPQQPQSQEPARPETQPTPAPATVQPAAPEPSATSNAAVNPAKRFHAAPKNALDLRNQSTISPSAPAAPRPPAVPAPAVPATNPDQSYAAITMKNAADRHEARLQRAATVEKSSLIQRFPGVAAGAVPAADPAPATPEKPAPAAPTAAQVPMNPDLAAALAATPEPAPIAPGLIIEPPAGPLTVAGEQLAQEAKQQPSPQPTAPELPPSVTSQIESMQKLTPPAQLKNLPQGQKPKALLSAPSYAAAALAVIIMSGYIWITNYPNLQIQVASGKAGIEASFPGYIPSGYRLNGPVAYAPGEITLNFRSADGDSRIAIAQRKTTWTSEALLDNYISPKTSDYLTVENQGLNIYLYNGNEASWVNGGIWYTIEGSSRLNRDQVLKIVNSL